MDNSFDIENRFDGLSEENKKLIRDLISFDKCLNALRKFKTFIDLISHKIKPNFSSYELHMFESLSKEVEEVFGGETDLTDISKQLSNSTKYTLVAIQPKTEEEKEINNFSQEVSNVVNENVVKAIAPNYFKGYRCDVCQRWLVTEDSLVIHKKNIHQIDQKVFYCEVEYCKYRTIFESELINHKDSHKTIKSKSSAVFQVSNEGFICSFNVCGQKFEDEDSLIVHIKDDHKVSVFRFKCYYGCNKRFPLEDNLKDHIQTKHKTEYSPNKCVAPNCYKMFRFECKLRQHTKIMHEKKYGCPHEECEFVGRSARGLETHLESHSKFKCSAQGCGHTFVQKLHLKEHQLIAHPLEKLFICREEGCEHSFKTESGLSKHIILHKDILLYCEWPGCGYTTKLKACLTRHKIIHSSELNYGCDWPECGKRFKTKDRLENHLRIHNNDKRYACHWPGCHYRCVDSGNRSKHEKQVHKRKMSSDFAPNF